MAFRSKTEKWERGFYEPSDKIVASGFMFGAKEKQAMAKEKARKNREESDKGETLRDIERNNGQERDWRLLFGWRTWAYGLWRMA